MKIGWNFLRSGDTCLNCLIWRYGVLYLEDEALHAVLLFHEVEIARENSVDGIITRLN